MTSRDNELPTSPSGIMIGNQYVLMANPALWSENMNLKCTSSKMIKWKQYRVTSEREKCISLEQWEFNDACCLRIDTPKSLVFVH